MKAFVSYSHQDEWALEELHKHLTVLRREGRFVEWFDRQLLGGGELDSQISAELEDCDVFIALVSPDFLNSDYCYDREMHRAIERQKEGEVRIIPLIVEPCDWKSTPLQEFKALPKDGKPISDWANRNNAFLDVVTELRRLVPDEKEKRATKSFVPMGNQAPGGASRYKVQHEFDDIEKSDYRRDALKVIRDYFEASVGEVTEIEGIKARFENMGSQSFTATVLNQGLAQGSAHITVHPRTERIGLADIYYAFSENSPPNTANGGFNIVSDGYQLLLEQVMTFDFDAEKEVSPERAAELLWVVFLNQAGISYA